MSTINEITTTYTKRVRDLADIVRGNEQATKQSLIGWFFTQLGYDLTDPRECIPEYKADFGKERSAKPIDWAFLNNGQFAFFVEAKEVGRKLAGFDEQLADYFSKDPNVKLGILTNGAHWRFFTDSVNSNIMDKEPFATWDASSDASAVPVEVLTLLQKSKFSSDHIRTFALRQRTESLLVTELSRLLEPSPEFVKLALQNIESRNLTPAVVENWKPILKGAIQQWAKQRSLAEALESPSSLDVNDTANAAGKIVTTQQEIEAFAVVARLLGAEFPCAYEDAVAYFKVHVSQRRTWVFARLNMDRRTPLMWVPLPEAQVALHAGSRALTFSNGWTSVALNGAADLEHLKDLLVAAYTAIKGETT